MVVKPDEEVGGEDTEPIVLFEPSFEALGKAMRWQQLAFFNQVGEEHKWDPWRQEKVE